jgi:glycerol-3-phosphate dehydrogenase subunit C
MQSPALRDLSAELCLKCNICTTACPVAPVTDLFPGPKYVGPQANRFRAPGQPSPDRGSVDYCSGCSLCSMACPHGVNVMEINAQARAAYLRETGLSLRNRILGRPETLGKLGAPFVPLSNVPFSFKPLRRAIVGLIGVDARASLPRFARPTFRRWFSRTNGVGAGGRKVLYFHGCGANYYEPHVGQAAVAVLAHNGCQVTTGEQNCCGLGAQSNGDFAHARALAEANVAKLVPYVEQGYVIVGTPSSCTLALKHDYQAILGLSGDGVRLLAEHTYDIFEYLWLLHAQGDLRDDFRSVPRQIAYHPPCQLGGHGVGHPATRILSLVPELEIVETGEPCCGAAGTYGLKREKYDIARQVGQPVFDAIRAVPGDDALCDSETCRWWLAGHTGRRMLHPIEILAEAYGLVS